VDTVKDESGKKRSVAHVIYRFAKPGSEKTPAFTISATGTDMRAATSISLNVARGLYG
jgi:hypothetical protein